MIRALDRVLPTHPGSLSRLDRALQRRQSVSSSSVVSDRAVTYGQILVTYASRDDDEALIHAMRLAADHRARLTIVVPVPDVSMFAYLAGLNVAQLRDDLVKQADTLARCALDRVPPDVLVSSRCVPRKKERALADELARGAYDLCIACPGRRDPGVFWGRMGLRLIRVARERGVAWLIAPTIVGQADE